MSRRKGVCTPNATTFQVNGRTLFDALRALASRLVTLTTNPHGDDLVDDNNNTADDAGRLSE